MEKDNAEKIVYARRKTDKEDAGAFDMKFDCDSDRHTYARGFADHCYNSLGFIAGALDMLFVITDAVAEATLGLGILLALFQNKATVQADEMDSLKW